MLIIFEEMYRIRHLVTVCATILATVSCGSGGIPDMPGAGVAAHYAACINDRIIVAGGCNFPDRPPYEGGSKAFYDDILLLGRDCWEKAGALPEPSAYGAFASDGTAMYVAGGANGKGALDSFISISLCNGKAGIRQLPPLPRARQQGAASIDGGYMYVAGGFGADGPERDVLRYDFASSSWDIAATLPQALVQPVMTVDDGMIYIWGGYNPESGKSITCGYRFNDGAWEEIPGAPDGGTMTGSASARDGNLMYVSGGVNNEVFDYALTLGPEETAIYQSQPEEYYRFRETIYRFDLQTGTWTSAGKRHESARAGAALIYKDGRLISTGGEIKACVRDPRSFIFKP